jgi:hypothetical protein
VRSAVGLLGTAVAVQIQPGYDQHDQAAARQRGGAPPGEDGSPEVADIELLAPCIEAEIARQLDRLGVPTSYARRRVRGLLADRAPGLRVGDAPLSAAMKYRWSAW